MLVMRVVTLEKITFKTVVEEIIVEKILKHCVEVEVSVMVESTVSLGTEEGIEIEWSALLAGALRSESVVLLAFVNI